MNNKPRIEVLHGGELQALENSLEFIPSISRVYYCFVVQESKRKVVLSAIPVDSDWLETANFFNQVIDQQREAALFVGTLNSRPEAIRPTIQVFVLVETNPEEPTI